MKIILAGGGSEKDSFLIDKEFVRNIPINKNILYLPIAMQEVEIYQDCFNWFKKTLFQLGIQNERIVMWNDLKEKKYSDLNNIGAIYIGGGNTFRLLNEIRKNSFDKILIRFLEENGIIYGGSAGAIIFGKDIITCNFMDKNKLLLEDTSGLDRLNGYSVSCHYKSENDKILEKYNLENIVAIPEKSGIIVNDHEFLIVGTVPVAIFTKGNKKTYKPGEKILI